MAAMSCAALMIRSRSPCVKGLSSDPSRGGDIAGELVRFAKEKNVSYVILGHSHRSRLEEFLRGNVINCFVREVGDVDVQVVS